MTLIWLQKASSFEKQGKAGIFFNSSGDEEMAHMLCGFIKLVIDLEC